MAVLDAAGWDLVIVETVGAGQADVEIVQIAHTTVVVDPGEERIKSEFMGVKCTMLPMHSILRIDEVKKQGQAKIKAAGPPVPEQTIETVKEDVEWAKTQKQSVSR